MMRTRTAATLPTIDEVKSAADSVYRVMHPTPHYCWPLLCERLGTEAWVKHENQTPTGSFKARTAVVPLGNSIEKNAAMRAQGATLIEYGEDYQAAREHAAGRESDLGYHFVPPYHRDIAKGVATYWLELLTAVADIDVAYVPIGMGSGICSGAAVRNGLGLKTKIVGVVSELAPCYALSFERGQCVEAPVSTKLADG